MYAELPNPSTISSEYYKQMLAIERRTNEFKNLLTSQLSKRASVNGAVEADTDPGSLIADLQKSTGDIGICI